MGRCCCECGQDVGTVTAYFMEKREACSARCAALAGLKSLKNPGKFEREFKDELIKNKPPLRSEAQAKAK